MASNDNDFLPDTMYEVGIVNNSGKTFRTYRIDVYLVGKGMGRITAPHAMSRVLMNQNLLIFTCYCP